MDQVFQSEIIEKKLNIRFHDKKILKLAFIHRSFWNENQGGTEEHNERLEFLGDSILGMLVADYLFSKHPDLDEGSLSTLRSQLVDAPACSSYVQKLNLAPHLLLGKGEQMNRGKGRDSILADLFEALIGALYLDQGLEAVRNFFFTYFTPEIEGMVANPQRNWKAELQDLAQKKYQQTPVYEVIEETGPAHSKHFKIAVSISEKIWGEGEGSSKKEAQTEAAKNALSRT